MAILSTSIVFHFLLCPQGMGVIEKEAQDALRLLSGKGNASRTDIVALNAGAILWVADKAGGLYEGVNLAGNIIARGRPLTKLTEWVKAQNREPEIGMTRLKALRQKAGIPS